MKKTIIIILALMMCLGIATIASAEQCNETWAPCGGGCTATDMTNMFNGVTSFDTTIGDITGWNTSCVTNMYAMFYGSDFNQDISGWDTSNVNNMSYMFYNTGFSQPIGNWNTSQVTDISWMFANGGHSGFNKNLSNWDTSKVTNMQGTFATINNFNGDISLWDTSSVTDMSYMFYASYDFNQPIGNWDVSKVNDMRWMFYVAFTFNQDLSLWNTSSVTNMDWMFRSANAFNGDIGTWDVSRVTSMSNIFTMLTLPVAIYDSILNGWASQIVQNGVPFDAGNSQYSSAALSARNDTLIGTYGWTITDGGMEIPTCSVCNETCTPCSAGPGGLCTATSMLNMFNGVTNFDMVVGNITGWNTSCITDMRLMFKNTDFNQPIGSWDVGNVLDMSEMFYNTHFNQDISGWDTSKVRNMQQMLVWNPDFNQNLGNWNISSIYYGMNDMFTGGGLSTANYDALLNGWVTTVQTYGVNLGAGNSTYSAAGQSARNTLVNDYGWIITDVPPTPSPIPQSSHTSAARRGDYYYLDANGNIYSRSQIEGATGNKAAPLAMIVPEGEPISNPFTSLWQIIKNFLNGIGVNI